jgi:hypothetical protein
LPASLTTRVYLAQIANFPWANNGPDRQFAVFGRLAVTSSPTK